MRYIYFFILCLLFSSLLYSSTINSENSLPINVLSSSKILIGDDTLDINSSTTRANFKPFHKKNLNIGTSDQNVWVEINLNNSSKHLINGVIVLEAPTLTNIDVYKQNGELIKKLSYAYRKQQTRFPYYDVSLQNNTSKKYYLKLKSNYLPLDFSIHFDSKEHFIAQNSMIKFYNIILLGFLIALILLSTLLYFVTKRVSHIYFILFVGFLTYYSFTCMGLTQLFASHDFAKLDISLSIIKLNFIAITSFLFTMTFLAVSQSARIYQLFKAIALVSILEIVIAGFINFSISIALMTLLVSFVLSVIFAIRSFRRGMFEALFLAIAYLLLSVLTLLVLLDAFALIAITPIQYNYTLFATTVALVFILVAYLVRYIAQYQHSNSVALDNLERKYIFDNMVQTKKSEIVALEKTKEFLISELSTTVDGNLNTLLVSLNSDDGSANYHNISRGLDNLKRRLSATAISHAQLVKQNELSKIDMQNVIAQIIKKIQSSYAHSECKVEVATEIDATLPMNDAVAASTTISELLINIYNQPCEDDSNVILYISLKNSGSSYSLSIKDKSTTNFDQTINEAKPTILQKLTSKLSTLRKEKNDNCVNPQE